MADDNPTSDGPIIYGPARLYLAPIETPREILALPVDDPRSQEWFEQVAGPPRDAGERRP